MAIFKYLFINDKLGIRNFDSVKIYSSTFHHPHLPTEQSSLDFSYLLCSKTLLQIILKLSLHCSRCWTKFAPNPQSYQVVARNQVFRNAIKGEEDLVTTILKHCYYRFSFNQKTAIPSSFHFFVVCINRWIHHIVAKFFVGNR